MDVTSTPLSMNPVSWFYTSTRPKQDTSSQSMDAEQNLNAMNWQTAAPTQTMTNAIKTATTAPAMNVGIGNGGTAAGGGDIDLYSRLRLGDDGTFRQKGHQQLFSRPWATTPFMNGGPSASDKDTESRLMQSMNVRQLKGCSTVTDKTFTGYWTPMIPELQAEMTNVNTYVEQFPRGGESSRLIFKNTAAQQ